MLKEILTSYISIWITLLIVGAWFRYQNGWESVWAGIIPIVVVIGVWAYWQFFDY